MKMMIHVTAAAIGLIATVPLFAQTSSAVSANTGSASTSAYGVVTGDVMAPEENALEDQLHALSERAFTFSPGGGGVSTTIVPATEMSVEAVAAATEDMNVMTRILANTLKQTGVRSSGQSAWSYNFGNWVGTPSASDIDSLYLQGYGVLFTTRVGIPLTPGPDGNEPKEPPAKAEVDSVWSQTRQDLYEPQTTRVRKSTAQQVKYSAEQVDNLKTAIITSFKHAANIRGLQPGESVIFTIIGQATPSSSIARIQRVQGTDDVVVVDNTNKATVYKGGLPEEVKQSAPTALTIRAKFSDVSAFAKGDLSLDQFRQKVQILSNPYLSGKTASGFFRTPLVAPTPAPLPGVTPKR